ncbi:hypothetical protein L227DRAFT_581126, partial [Lentinus tigrinus ALCF2SS1-6]
MWLLSALSLRECNETIGYIELKPTITPRPRPRFCTPSTCPRCAVFGNRPPSVQDAPLRVPGTRRWTGFEHRRQSRGVVDDAHTNARDSEAIFMTLKLAAH